MASARFSRGTLGLQALTAVCAVAVLVALYAIFVVAPIEKQMGIVYKILFFHAPAAYAMYVGFTISAFASAMFLAKRDDRWDAWAVAGAEVGLMFCVIMLTTGPLWARKAWGTYWTWDPRLTTTMLAAMIYLSYVVLRAFASGGEVEKKFAAGLSIFGLLDLPVIHYSVKAWRGTHPTVITGSGGGLHRDMYPALILGFVFFTLLAALLIWSRARVERTRQQIAQLESDAAELGLLEESA
jgi:heme exporter protein C